MQRKTILTLGGFGLLMGLASVFGLTEDIEPVLGILIALFSS